MAGVFIDIPGVGTVEAKNAATESTLRELVNIMKGQSRGGGGAGGGGGIGGALGGAAGGKGASSVAGAASKLAKGFLGVVGIAGQVAGAFGRLSETAVKVISDIANVGDSLTSAAGVMSGVLSNIPIVGGAIGAAFQAAAGAAEKLQSSFLTAASAGASFGGSMNKFVASATAAGMEMSKFGQFIRNNGAGMLAFGGNVESGVNNFLKLSKAVRATGSDLYALGFSTEDINQGIAKYGELLRIQGRQGTMSNAQLAASAKNYMKEMDLLAKVTGEERSQAEARMKAEMTNAQFAAFMSTRNKDVAESFGSMMAIVNKASPELANTVRDFVTTGSLTSEQTAQIGATMGPGFMKVLEDMRKAALNNQVLTKDKQDQYFRDMGKAGKEYSKTFGEVASATAGAMDGPTKAMIGTFELATLSTKEAQQAQANAAKNTDGMNQSLDKAKQELAAISNEFTLFLASSGILQDMLSMFKSLVGFVKTYLMPVFSALSGVIKFFSALFEPIIYGLMLFNPVFRGFVLAFTAIKVLYEEFTIAFGGLGGVLSGLQQAGEALKTVFDLIFGAIETGLRVSVRFLIDGFLKIKDTIYDYMYPALQFFSRISDEVGKVLRDTFGAAVKWTSEKLNDLGNWFKKIGDEIASWTWVKTIRDTFNKIAESVGNFFRSFNKLSEVSEYLGIKFADLGIAFDKMILWVDKKTTFFADDKDKKRFADQEKAIQDAEKANLERANRLEQQLAKNREKNLADQKVDEKKRDDERKARDKRIADDRKKLDKENANHKRGLDSAGAKQAAADIKTAVECASMDYNLGPEALLKAYADKEDSPVAKKVKEEAKRADKAEALKASAKEITSTGAIQSEEARMAAAQAAGQKDAKKKEVEAARQALIQQSENQKAASAKEIEATKKAMEQMTATGQPKSGSTPGQNPNYDYLNALNTTMAQLVKQNKDLIDINNRQLSTMRGLSNDMYAT